MEIREVRREEYEEAGEVIARAYAEFEDPQDTTWGEHMDVVRDVGGRVDRTVVLVAVEDGRILGSATIELNGVVGDDDRAPIPGVAGLRMVGVDPSLRRRGIARSLLREVIARCRAAGKHTLMLRTMPPMVPARHLYESLDFERATDIDLPVSDRLTLMGYRLTL
jgi:GNAT superfamily N-acetyltransferase